MENTNKNIELTNKKIDRRLDTIDDEVKLINKRFDDNDAKQEDQSRRMDQRLKTLEEEMLKSTLINKRSNELRQAERELKTQERSGKLDKLTSNHRQPTTTRSDEVTDMILKEPAGTFRSSWAQNLQKELENAAKVAVPTSASKPGSEDSVDNTKMNDILDKEPVPNCWDDDVDDLPSSRNFVRKPAPPVRRPAIVKNWFGLDSTTDESEPGSEEWSSVDRVRKSKERKMRAARKKEEKKRECALRASHMVSIGPISLGSINYFRKQGENFEDAKKSATKEFMKYNLNYSDDDLVDVMIAETRLSTRGDDIVNVAFVNEVDVKELYVRKAESKNENILLRCYIPPNYYERYMCLNRICADKRAEDPGLKTQLRFGKNDIEVYTKTKGGDAGYRKVKLNEFTDMTLVPNFNHEIKWKVFADKPPRKSCKWVDKGQRPSTMGTRT